MGPPLTGQQHSAGASDPVVVKHRVDPLLPLASIVDERVPPPHPGAEIERLHRHLELLVTTPRQEPAHRLLMRRRHPRPGDLARPGVDPLRGDLRPWPGRMGVSRLGVDVS